MYILHHLSTCQKPCQEETTCSPYTNKTVLTEQSSTTGHAREPQSLFILRCKKRQHAGRTVETFQDLLAWPATDELDRREEKRVINTQEKEHNIRTEMYSLEVTTSVFL